LVGTEFLFNSWWILLTRNCFEGARTSLIHSPCSKKTESDDKQADSKPDTAAKKAAEGEKA
jgi:hypothetical protein